MSDKYITEKIRLNRDEVVAILIESLRIDGSMDYAGAIPDDGITLTPEGFSVQWTRREPL